MSYIDCHICLESGADPPARAAPGSLVCSRHFERVRQLLTEISAMHALATSAAWLMTTREPASDYTKSLPPCSLDPIVVTDPRSRMTSRRDPVSAPRVIAAWCSAVGDSRNEWSPSGRDLKLAVAYLNLRLHWILAQPAASRFARHVAASHRSLNRVVQYV